MNTETSSENAWKIPVLIRIGHGSSEQVASPSSALDYMKNRWPHERGSNYQKAVKECQTAVDGLCAAESARTAFIAAALESYVLA
jgi:hypothetical protein